ncbi:hypothetical protein [Streptomyces sp. MB09-02B]|uniref:hypothetical protein n=1 Tax=Streptomyces sp. MB09-02B TaxID=3028667 RepID=UPI0029A73901|nr:hypothetical protein [Streptomyces sp. MB09-02B]MDX3643549.1 hypothetical protein [Streptomyces sp. MB09-02B]
MTDLIGRLLAWMSLVLNPTGVHRRVAHPDPRPSAPPVHVPPLPTSDSPLPVHRSPYGVHGLLDGAATIAVRPYVIAVPGSYWAQGMEVAA